MSIPYEDAARMALGFVLETETWPVFVRWVSENASTERAREFADNPVSELALLRREWAQRSPWADIRGVIE